MPYFVVSVLGRALLRVVVPLGVTIGQTNRGKKKGKSYDWK